MADRDAAFREALEEFADAYYYYRDCWVSESTRVDAARARVLALYDEASRGMTPEESAQYKAFLRSRFKSAERQGEEGMVVMNKYGDLYVNVTPQHFENGDRVRVVDEMDLHDEMEAKLAVERDALVPLLRYFLAEFVDDGDEVPRHDCGFVRRPESGYCEFHDKWVQAQAILAREAGE